MRYEDVDWEQASCRGVNTELFYLEINYEAFTVNPQLRRMCTDCPILADCREYAILNENHGFWAGLTAKQRNTLRARMNRSRRAA